MRADTLIHEALHRLLVRSTVELVALLIVVTACTVCDFPLAQHMNLVIFVGIVVGVHREREVLFIANALTLAAQRTDAELGDALIRVATLLFVVNYRQAGSVLGIRHESRSTDALLLVADGVCRAVGAVRILLAGKLTGRYDRMTRVLVDYKVIGTGTIVVDVVAVREVIVNNALLINLAGLTQGNGLTHTMLPLSARYEALLADAKLGLLVTVGVLRKARALSPYLIGCLDNHRLAIGLIPAVHQLAVAYPIGARAFNGTALEHLAVLIILAAQLDQFAGTNGSQ